MASSTSSIALSLAALAAVGSYMIYDPLQHALTAAGTYRTAKNYFPSAVKEWVEVKDTIHCEDLHYYARANTLFTACEDNAETRFSWFPPLVNMVKPLQTQGSIHSINPTASIRSKVQPKGNPADC